MGDVFWIESERGVCNCIWTTIPSSFTKGWNWLACTFFILVFNIFSSTQLLKIVFIKLVNWQKVAIGWLAPFSTSTMLFSSKIVFMKLVNLRKVAIGWLAPTPDTHSPLSLSQLFSPERFDFHSNPWSLTVYRPKFTCLTVGRSKFNGKQIKV